MPSGSAGLFFVVTNPGHGLSRENTKEDRNDLCKKIVEVGEESTKLVGGRIGWMGCEQETDRP